MLHNEYSRESRSARSAFRLLLCLFVLTTCLGASGKVKHQKETQNKETDTSRIQLLDMLPELPSGLAALPTLPIPAGNPQTRTKVDLGRQLFFDTRLSGDNSISCSSCHSPDHFFSDGKPLAIGFGGKVLKRRSPSVLNAAFNSYQFWDGRAASLEEQATGPILSKDEMNLAGPAVLAERLRADANYRRQFMEAFGEEPAIGNVAKAIASYERTLITPNTRFDRYANGDKSALTAKEKRGLLVFIGRGHCGSCHNGPNFADNKFYILGDETADVGRYNISKNSDDMYAFKTSSLRSIAPVGPYMHNGSRATLEEVIEFYNQGGGAGSSKSNLLKPLGLTAQERADLKSFLLTLIDRHHPDSENQRKLASR